MSILTLFAMAGLFPESTVHGGRRVFGSCELLQNSLAACTRDRTQSCQQQTSGGQNFRLGKYLIISWEVWV
jgi:hypothetical protein